MSPTDPWFVTSKLALALDTRIYVQHVKHEPNDGHDDVLREDHVVHEQVEEPRESLPEHEEAHDAEPA